MKLEVQIAGRGGRLGPQARKVQVEVARAGPRLLLRLDGRELEADAVEVATGTYSILLQGQSFEVRVQPEPDGRLHVQTCGEEFPVEILDPRVWRGKRGGVLEAEGRQQVTAPMPGKIVRLLVAAGDTVEAGQGLLVVEAMKMQNEIRAPKSGTVERIFVSEGQPVTAGHALAIVS